MNVKKYSYSFWGTFLTLLLFWILITGRVHWQHLLVGILCSFGIAHFNQDILLVPEERPLFLKTTIKKWIIYFYILVVEVFKANWGVAAIVLNPKLDISPGFVKFRTDVKKPMNRVILANSITLTPGTLTIEVEDDVYIVHAITRANAEDVATWSMMDRLIEIEGMEKDAS